ncbi:MAG: hypothetical protein ABIY71_01480, partial [Flavobacteriales bacterium]
MTDLTRTLLLVALFPSLVQGQSMQWLAPLDLAVPYNSAFSSLAMAVDDQAQAAVLGPAGATTYYSGQILGDLAWKVFDPDGQPLISTVFPATAGAADMVSRNGSFYVIGPYLDSLRFPGQALLSTVGEIQALGHFISRVEIDGTVSWVKDANELGLGELQALAVDADGILYIAAWDFQNSVVARMDVDGNMLGTWTLAGVGVLSDVAVTASGSVAIAGSCLDQSVDLNGTPVTNPFSDYTLLMATFTSGGTLVNHLVVNDITCPFPSVELDDAGNTYFSADASLSAAAGAFTVTDPEWANGEYLVRMDTAGTITWLNQPVAGNSFGDAARALGRDLVLAQDGGVWQGGFSRGNLSWGNEVYTSAAIPGQELYFRRVDASGHTQQMVTGDASNFRQTVQSLATFGNDAVYMLGYAHDTLHLAGLEFPEAGYHLFLTRWQGLSTGISGIPGAAPLSVF